MNERWAIKNRKTCFLLVFPEKYNKFKTLEEFSEHIHGRYSKEYFIKKKIIFEDKEEKNDYSLG